MSKKNNWWIFISLFLITLLAWGLRFYKLADVPPGLNRDEAAIGYTAFSLLETGKDEYGKAYPLSFKSFGDWKVPVYFYLAMPFIRVFGLTEVAVRLPSALLGTVTVLLVFILIQKLFYQFKQVNTIALLGSLFLAISPWHIFMSRNASESNTAVFFVTLSLIFFLKSFKKPWFLIISFSVLSLSIFTYHGNHIFTPLLFIGLNIIYRNELKKNRYLISSILIFLFLSALIFSQTLFSADKTKISGLFPLGDDSLVYENIVKRRLEYPRQTFLVKILHNKPVYLVKTVVINYLKSISPEFLFISGGTNSQHNIPGFGNLYLWEAFVWPIGIIALILIYKKSGLFLLWWLLISPVAGSITKDAPHTNRMMGILPLPAIITALGVYTIAVFLDKIKFRITGKVIIFLIIAGNFLVFTDQYFNHFPYVSAKDWGNVYKQMVSEVTRIGNRYQGVVIAKPEVSPYIYFLFYDQINPSKFQNEVIRYPETAEGFQHVKKFANYNFEKINWTNELFLPNRLLIDWADGLPEIATHSAQIITQADLDRLNSQGWDTGGIKTGDLIISRIVDTIYLPDKTPYLYLIETLKSAPTAEISN